ncbi:hypothetical protein NPIL_238421 [Nephila pilipes]|uniref:Uncharacterized protein n=1 Tax=Nephila pilipes TaxID=299642 RepID=A0A8X6MHH7_NEPPI|nr:hypothetical protein NPIL_238421 [Nephila pilipes]
MSAAIKTVSKPPSPNGFFKQNWKELIPGALLSGAGLGYCLYLNMKKRNYWTIVSFIAGSFGVTLVNLAVFDMFEMEQFSI